MRGAGAAAGDGRGAGIAIGLTAVASTKGVAPFGGTNGATIVFTIPSREAAAATPAGDGSFSTIVAAGPVAAGAAALCTMTIPACFG